MELYYSDVLAPRKACAAAKYLKADVTFVYLDVGKQDQKAPAYLAINPNGTVPALKDGERIIWEADAIMCYLSEKAGSDFWPRDERQIDVMRWLSWNAHHFNRCCGELYFEHVIKARFKVGAPDQTVVEASRTSFRKFAAVLDDHLKGRAWMIGGSPTVADFAVAISLPYAEQARMPVADYPAVQAWHDRISQLEGWLEPFPNEQGRIQFREER